MQQHSKLLVQFAFKIDVFHINTINWYLSIVNMTYENNIILLIEWFQFGTVYLTMW